MMLHVIVAISKPSAPSIYEARPYIFRLFCSCSKIKHRSCENALWQRDPEIMIVQCWYLHMTKLGRISSSLAHSSQKIAANGQSHGEVSHLRSQKESNHCFDARVALSNVHLSHPVEQS